MNTLAVLTLFAALIATPTAHASGATPEASPVAAGALMEIVIDEVSPESTVMAGLTRTTLVEDESLRIDSASGPALFFIEEGSASVEVSEGGEPAQVVRASTPESGWALDARAGDGVLLPPGTSTVLSNSGDTPLRILTLMASPDAGIETDAGTAPAILVSRELEFPKSPVIVTLESVSLDPGASLALPEVPAMVVYGTVNRSDAYLLSAQGFNRGSQAMDVYVLVIAPA